MSDRTDRLHSIGLGILAGALWGPVLSVAAISVVPVSAGLILGGCIVTGFAMAALPDYFIPPHKKTSVATACAVTAAGFLMLKHQRELDLADAAPLTQKFEQAVHKMNQPEQQYVRVDFSKSPESMTHER